MNHETSPKKHFVIVNYCEKSKRCITLLLGQDHEHELDSNTPAHNDWGKFSNISSL